MLFSQSSHTVTFTHLACSWRSFSWACLSKLASCPCVEHAHQTSSTLPVWHMHARHVQWHPHNKLATERINFPVHYSTDVCFNFFLMERRWFSINRQKANTAKVKKNILNSIQRGSNNGTVFSRRRSRYFSNIHLQINKEQRQQIR